MIVLTMAFRFAVVFIFALVFGLERQRAHKPIGFGTFVFVSIGACALALISVITNQGGSLPLLAAIVTGIGFLGAGALIKTTDKIFGFTTAASIWLFSIIGLTIGIGEYIVGSILYFLCWMVVFIDRQLENRGIGSYQKKITIRTTKDITSEELHSVLQAKRYKLVSVEINTKSHEYFITLLLEGAKADINDLPKRLFKVSWVASFKIE
ncbi:MgtC/SapB family protein [Candidatus Woesearchaeota archaeon]|nr:MgtC/SapB family protein [Candidatus Woesearchaeota archaeon]